MRWLSSRGWHVEPGGSAGPSACYSRAKQFRTRMNIVKDSHVGLVSRRWRTKADGHAVPSARKPFTTPC